MTKEAIKIGLCPLVGRPIRTNGWVGQEGSLHVKRTRRILWERVGETTNRCRSGPEGTTTMLRKRGYSANYKNLLLFSQPTTTRAETLPPREDQSLRKRAKYLVKCKEAIWLRWTKEPIHGLRERGNSWAPWSLK